MIEVRLAARSRRALLRSCAVAAALALSPAALAQDQPDTMLVLDASNSMWGQIDGTAKIEIAREALDSLLEELPASERMGLIAYGHHQAGQCSDIELVRPLGPVDRAALSADVHGLTPRGKTPLTDAVRKAAGELSATGRGGTVVLLSDGVETCGGDPCALAAELAASGVDLKAHVIGFDIQTPGDRERLACIADRTGGIYLDAGDAAELTRALSTVSDMDDAEPIARALPLIATDGVDGPIVEGALFYVLGSGDQTVIGDGISGEIDLAPGGYRVAAMAGERSGARDIRVTPDEPDRIVIPLDVEIPDASISAADDIAAGHGALFAWEGPDGPEDYLELTGPEGEPLETSYYAWTRDGSPAEIQMPGEPGRYRVNYVSASLNTVLATLDIESAPAPGMISAPESVDAGAELTAIWSGPGNPGDWIGFTPSGGSAGENPGSAYANVEASDGEVTLRAPGAAGDYDLIYVIANDQTVLVREPITVTDALASVSGPDEVKGGWTIEADWTGPAGGGDFLSIVRPGSDASAYIGGAWAYADAGSPAVFRAPVEPGEYELRYVQEASDGTSVLASRPITIVEGPVAIAAPDSVTAGEVFTVTVDGPLGPEDYVDFAAPGADAGDYSGGYAYANQTTVTLTAPDATGAYTLRYIVSVDGAQVIGERAIAVE